jgi:hypothetical protein
MRMNSNLSENLTALAAQDAACDEGITQADNSGKSGF